MVPILATILVGIATKIGVGLAATAAKKLATKDPAKAGAVSNGTFADELQRATPGGPTAGEPTTPFGFAPAAPMPSAPTPGAAGSPTTPAGPVTQLPAVTVPVSAAAAVRALARQARLSDAAAVQLAHARRAPAPIATSTPEAAFAVGASAPAPASSSASETPGGRFGNETLPVATRVPTRRRQGFFARRMRQLHVAAYRRMDVAR